MGVKKKKDKEAKRASSSSALPATQDDSTHEAPIQTGVDSSVTPPTHGPPPVNPVTVSGQSRKRKRSETEQGGDVSCPICFSLFKSMQSLRGHMHMHEKSERERFFGSSKSKVLKRKELISAMNLTSIKAAVNFRPINNQASRTADAMEDPLLGTPQRTMNPNLDIDCNRTPPEGTPSSSPPPPSPPGEHPGFPFNLNRSPPPSPGAAGQAQAAPVV